MERVLYWAGTIALSLAHLHKPGTCLGREVRAVIPRANRIRSKGGYD